MTGEFHPLRQKERRLRRSTSDAGIDRPLSLGQFTLGDMLRCGTGLRRAMADAPTVESAAQSAVRYLYGAFRSPDGARQCPLVRFYRTHRFERLDDELKDFARHMMQRSPTDGTLRCLTLMASAGERPEWNDRRKSKGHRAIPLPSLEVVERAPMIAQLIRQFGLDIEAVVSPSSALLQALQGKTYNVFHVENARGSPYIPAQEEFVAPYRIESVLGFGGLVGEELFALILFSTVGISEEVATRFRNIALDVKSSLIGYRDNEVFDPPSTRGVAVKS